MCFHRDDFMALGGFPDNFYGWGHEDANMDYRLDNYNAKIEEQDEKRMENFFKNQNLNTKT